MKFTYTLLACTAAALMAGCGNTGQTGATPATNTSSMAPATTAPTTMSGNNNTAMAPANNASSTMPANAASSYGTAGTNWFGGPIYNGKPDLDATAALVKAGGGADHFDFSKALVSMLGKKTVDAEVAKLNKQYGKEKVNDFVDGMTFAVTDALKRATEAGVKLPDAPADLKGKTLAKRLVKDGTAPDNTFWAGYMFDKTISHQLHNEVMADIDAKSSHKADANTHRILNQAMYDVAQALGQKDVKLASFH